MRRIFATVWGLALFATPDLVAQDLQKILAQHEQRMAAVHNAEDPDKAHQQAMQALEVALRKLLARAKGDERRACRFTLVEVLLGGRQEAAARKVLEGFDPAGSNPKQCMEAAIWAGQMGQNALRDRFVRATLDKPMPLELRMKVYSMIGAQLALPKRSAALFAKAMAAAKTDEDRATILWYEAAAIREREDLPEGSYEKALEKLAKAQPKTRYGRIAHDRLQAMSFRVGSPALDYQVQDFAGKPMSNRSVRGKALLVCFIDTEHAASAKDLRALAALRKDFAAGQLAIHLLALDEDAKAAKGRLTRLVPGLRAAAAGGWEGDLALRFRVEASPQVLLLDAKGNIAGMNYLLRDSYSLGTLRRRLGSLLKR